MRRVLWIFAHQDDEVAAAARMLEQRRRGDDIHCVYLTDGAAYASAAVRNRESTNALASIGVTNIVFFSRPDGALYEHVDASLAELEARFDGVTFDEVGCLAWEGGHHDHDASHLVALAFAARRKIDAWEVPLYNGAGVPGALFRVMRPLGAGWESRRLTFSDAVRIVMLARFYPSQRRTWLGLLPELLVRVLAMRRSFVRRALVSRAGRAPHGGRLYYERRFGCSREAFLRATAPFVAKHFGDVTLRCPVCAGERFTHKRLLPNLAASPQGHIIQVVSSALFAVASDITHPKGVSYAHIDDGAYLQSIGRVRQSQAKAIVGAVKATGTWLDLGCGFGFLLDEARRAGFTVRGVEPNAKAAAQARARLGDVVSAADDDAPADVISTLDVLEHVELRALSAFAENVRRRAAVWVIKVPSADGLFYKVAHALLPFSRGVVRRLWQSDHEYPHTVYFDRPTLTRFLEQHGFTVEQVRYVDEVPAETATSRMLLDPTIPRWQARLATPLVRVVNAIERWRGVSDALVVIARRKG